MINVMALRRSYERREVTEVRWIYVRDNPADSTTKKTLAKAFEELITTERMSIGVIGWIE